MFYLLHLYSYIIKQKNLLNILKKKEFPDKKKEFPNKKKEFPIEKKNFLIKKKNLPTVFQKKKEKKKKIISFFPVSATIYIGPIFQIF